MVVKFEIYSEGNYWSGRGIGVDIFTQGKTLDELMENIREAVGLHFEEQLEKGESIRIQSPRESHQYYNSSRNLCESKNDKTIL